jgi:trk system potassium uptake protein TrkH
MNFKIIFRIIGFLLMLAGIFMMLGIPFSIYYQTDDISALLVSGVFTSLIGFVIWFFTRKQKKKELGKREGYLIVTLGWLSMALFGSIPFIIYGVIPNYTDAFFETMSGFTTTGATILEDIESVPAGLLFWRSLTQ